MKTVRFSAINVEMQKPGFFRAFYFEKLFFMKELIINGIVYAKYKIEGHTLYIKMIKKIIRRSEKKSEELLVDVIQSIEDTKFFFLGYLNV